MTSAEISRALDLCRVTSSSLNPCLAWLLKAGRLLTTEWIEAIISGYLLEGRVPLTLKETLIKLIQKKLNLTADDIKYRPVSNIPFIGKLVERVVADQFQAFLEEIDALDPFQSGFRPCHGMEMALVTLQYDLLREGDRAKCPC